MELINKLEKLLPKRMPRLPLPEVQNKDPKFHMLNTIEKKENSMKSIQGTINMGHVSNFEMVHYAMLSLSGRAARGLLHIPKRIVLNCPNCNHTSHRYYNYNEGDINNKTYKFTVACQHCNNVYTAELDIVNKTIEVLAMKT